MNHDAYDDNYIRAILTSVKTIAMVGASPVNVRTSYFAFKYLVERGYDMSRSIRVRSARASSENLSSDR